MTEQQVTASFFLTEPTTNIGPNPHPAAFGLPAVIAPSPAILRRADNAPETEWMVLMVPQEVTINRFNEYDRPSTMLVVLNLITEGKSAIGIVRPVDSEDRKSKYIGLDKLIVF